MSVTCLRSHTINDLRCPVCGQGFLLFPAMRLSSTARELVRRAASAAMRRHHGSPRSGMEVHPGSAFSVRADDHGFSSEARGTSVWEPAMLAVC